MMGQAGAPQRAKVIEAEEFRVVDAAGNERGRFGLFRYGEQGEDAVLWLRSGNGPVPAPQVKLGATRTGEGQLDVYAFPKGAFPRGMQTSILGFSVRATPNPGSASFTLNGLHAPGLTAVAALDGRSSLAIHETPRESYPIYR
jgi:hypothetical protein